MKILILILSLFFATNSIGQTSKLIATSNNGTVQIHLNSSDYQNAFNTISSYFGKSGTIKNVLIDDPDPNNTNSIAYLDLEANNGQESILIYVQLKKVIVSNTKIEYYGESNFSGGSCACDGCSSCKKIRKWFLGEVTGCDCKKVEKEGGHCNHSTGEGPTWYDILIRFFDFFH